MTKEQELMAYLHKKVFDPILNSSTASKELRSGINLTIGRMNRLNAEGMLHFYWAVISGTERSIVFGDKIRREGFTCFEDIREEFKTLFDDDWLSK